MVSDLRGRRPLYLDVADALKAQIESGKYPPGRHLPPERELVTEFGCSRATVRLAVDRLISLGLAERRPKRGVVVWGERVQRQPEAASRFADTVGIVMPSANWHTNSMRVLHACQSTLYQNSYYAIVCDTGYENLTEAMHKEAEHIESMVQKGVPGMIIWPNHQQPDLEVFRRAQKAGMAIVLIDREIPGFDCDYVGVDNVGGANEATRHLIAHGHTKIAHLTLPVRPTSLRERLEGYRQALEEAGLPYDEDLVAASWAHTDQMNSVIREITSRSDRPTAVFCATDHLAGAAIARLHYLGFSIPNDIAIIGFDDDLFAKWSPVPLTTVEQPFEVIGQEAVRLLMTRIRERIPTAPKKMVLPVRMILRQSCGASTTHGF